MKLLNSHLSTQQLADAIDGRGDVAVGGSFQNHLSACSHCAAEYTALEKAINLMKADDSAAAPAAAVNFAVNLFRASKKAAEPSISLVQKIAATLKLDLASALTPAFGERSGAVGAERQMLLTAGDFDIDLRIRASESGFTIFGQVLGEIDSNYSIHLAGGGFEVQTPIDEFGSFSFSSVPSVDDLSISLITGK